MNATRSAPSPAGSGGTRRIIGIDPGSRVTGYGIIDSDGRYSRHVDSGCLQALPATIAERLGVIFEEVAALVHTHRPQVMAVEQVFVARNPAAALKLGHARGAAICAAVEQRLEIHEYTPRAIKQAVVGTGAADKAQVQHMVRRLLALAGAPASDAADALAVALCHAHTAATQARLAGALAESLPR